MAEFSTVARPYARAAFDVARQDQDLAGWSAALAAAAALVADPAARAYLSRPELKSAQRADFLTSLCADLDDGRPLTSGHGQNFLRLLAENDRLGALPEIWVQFEELKTEIENKIRVTLVAATAVDESLASKVASSLRQKFGRDVELTLEVDETLLGGAVIRAKDMVIDGSVQTRLKRLASALID